MINLLSIYHEFKLYNFTFFLDFSKAKNSIGSFVKYFLHKNPLPFYLYTL